MSTPVARLEMAISGRTAFVGEILKAVFGQSEEEKQQAALESQKADPAAAAEQLLSILKDRQSRDQSRKTKPRNK